MPSHTTRAKSARRYAVLFGTTSLLAASAALAQTDSGQNVEQVIVTGSLIAGSSAVGVPVTSLSTEDFRQTGALTTSDLLKSVPSIEVIGSLSLNNSGANAEQGQPVSIHGIGGVSNAPKTLLLIDNRRFPVQGNSGQVIDPSIIPTLAVDRIDVLADGASATYGADAVAGVINVVLKRGFEGAVSQFQMGESTGIGGLSIDATQLYGRKWDGGDVTFTYDYYHVAKIAGPARDYYTYDFSPWGLDNQTPLASAYPGIVSTGKPAAPLGAPAGFNANVGTTCANCYSIPHGQNGVGLTWAQILANPGVGNEVNPYDLSWIIPDQTRNGAVITFDQQLMPGVKLYFNGFYNNRRSIVLFGGYAGSSDHNAMTAVIPTSNPYYPIGAPAGLQVSYNFNRDLPKRVQGSAVSSRWEPGIDFDLPFDWKGQVFYANTMDHEFNDTYNYINLNNVNAALGNTVAASGNFPAYTKPAGVPYLNLFCDPTAFTCNSAQTISYINGYKQYYEKTITDEGGINFSGPVFDLPGGTVKAAVGLDYYTQHYTFTSFQSANSFSIATPNLGGDANYRNVWAAFAQFNVPLVGDANKLPLVERLEVELSGRIDHYSDFGTTKNPKIALDWGVGGGLTLHATWGTSFRAPTFQESSSLVANIQAVNIAGGAALNGFAVCQHVGVDAPAGTAAAYLNPHCLAALNNPGGISVSGGAGAAAGLRDGVALNPETSRSWALGFEYAPTYSLLKGLDLSATMYNLKINGTIQPFTGDSGMDDPLGAGHYITIADPDFAAKLASLTKSPLVASNVIPSAVQFIVDNANRNIGWTLYKGVDFNGSYSWDMDDLGAWDAGVSGTYYLSNKSRSNPDLPLFDFYTGNSGGRLDYRTHLGWTGGSDSQWTVTGFMNYHAHSANRLDFTKTITERPPSCFLLGNAPCNASGLPQFAEYSQQYATLGNLEPAWITFDLSVGYDTGTRAVNPYLNNIAVQLTANNILDRRPDFAYIIATSGGSPAAFNRAQSPLQRYVTFVVRKEW